MSDAVETGRGLVPVQHHQFDISDEDGSVGDGLDRGHNGLVRVIDGAITVMTGIHTGDVDVTVTLHNNEPTPDDGEWQEIVEISASSASGELMVRGILDDLDEELPALSFNGPGSYRLRIHARGRDTAVDQAPDEATASETVTATATRDLLPSNTPRPGLTPTPNTSSGGDPGPEPSKSQKTSSQTRTGPTETFTSPSTDQDGGPVLGGWGVNAAPRLDSADCSQPIVFTLSAAAQRPGTVEYTWHPDDRLIARGVQDRAGTMTFTTTNEQHDEFTVQLTGTQPGERVQGGMTVEVTAPQANRGTSGDVFDITCT